MKTLNQRYGVKSSRNNTKRNTKEVNLASLFTNLLTALILATGAYIAFVAHSAIVVG